MTNVQTSAQNVNLFADVLVTATCPTCTHDVTCGYDASVGYMFFNKHDSVRTHGECPQSFGRVPARLITRHNGAEVTR